MKPINLATVSTILLSLVISSCASSPSGRNQLVLLSDSDLNQMGVESFETMKAQIPASQNNTLKANVQCVADRIIAVLPKEYREQNWEVVLFEDDQANAFALPGYKIGVYTGLLKVAKNQSQLAAVVGHEVGHVVARHSNERASAQMATQQVLAVGQQIAGKESATKNIAFQALGLGAQYGIILPYSRAHESEADIIGLDLMAQAGFNPQESVRLWENMSANGGEEAPEMMSTHPSNQNRIAALNEKMAQPNAVYSNLVATNRQARCY